jgi:hypothetical protein
MTYQYQIRGVTMSWSDEDRAILMYDLCELRKDLKSLQVRIRFQIKAGCQERAGRLQREYMRQLRKYHTMQDRLFARVEVAA